MRIYITGIAGMLGANIAYELRNKYEVTGADLIQLNMDNVQCDIIDLTDINELNTSIEYVQPDVVIHTAAAVNVDLCEKDAFFAEKLNYTLTKNLSDICDKNCIKLIYISTDAVFDGEKKGLYTEDNIVNPINVYGLTKLKGESAVLKIPQGTVLRTNIYGFNIQEKSSIGEWILYSLLKGERLNMFTDVLFSPILVNELANLIDMIISEDVSGLYHACGTGSISKYEFAILIKETFGIKDGEIVPSLSTSFNFNAKRSKNMGMSNLKLSDKLKVEISTPNQSIQKFKQLYDEGFSEFLKAMR